MANKTKLLIVICASLITSIIILCIVSTPFFLNILTINQPIAKSDAIVLMAGNMKERLPVAARLFNEKFAPLIILANGGIVGEWSTKMNRNLLHIELAEERLVTLGVPREKIVKLPYYGSATMFDALAVKEYIVKNGLREIIVVTSDYHTRRTLWTFKKVLRDHAEKISIAPVKSVGTDLKSLMLEYVKFGYYIIKFGLFGFVPQLNEIRLL